MSEKETFALWTKGIWTPLRVGAHDSEGFAQILDLDGKVAFVMEVSKKDRNEGFANIILWHLVKARDEICSREDAPRNDTRVKMGGNGWVVKQAIDDVIRLYKANFRIDPIRSE